MPCKQGQGLPGQLWSGHALAGAQLFNNFRKQIQRAQYNCQHPSIGCSKACLFCRVYRIRQRWPAGSCPAAKVGGSVCCSMSCVLKPQDQLKSHHSFMLAQEMSDLRREVVVAVCQELGDGQDGGGGPSGACAALDARESMDRARLFHELRAQTRMRACNWGFQMCMNQSLHALQGVRNLARR